MDFKEWFDGHHSNNESYAKMIARDAFEAGQQSKQAEIDALKAKIDDALELINNQHDTSTIKFVRYAINKTLKGE